MSKLTYTLNGKYFEEMFEDFNSAFSRYLEVTESEDCKNAQCVEI